MAEYEVISSDEDHAPMPRVMDKSEGPEWWANGMYLAVSGRRAKALLTPENEARIDRIAETGFYEDGPRPPSDPELRIAERDGTLPDLHRWTLATTSQASKNGCLQRLEAERPYP